MKPPQGIKVKRIRTYNSVQLGAVVVTGVDAIKQKVQMSMYQSLGVLIEVGAPWNDKIVPFANICEIDIERENDK
jgi:hypothetical protein